MKLGNYNLNEIYNEDCITAMGTLPDSCIDFILTDPPYNISFSSRRRKNKFKVILNDDLTNDDFDALLKNYFTQCFRVLKKNTFLITFMDWSTIPAFNKALTDAGFEIKSMPIWVKNNFGLGFYTRPQYEPMYLCMKGKPKPPNNAISDVLNYAKVQDLIHSCQKPTPLLIKLIQTFGPRGGGVILDGFAGSGSTAIAAMDTQNNFLTYELDALHYNNAKNRIAKRKAEPTIFDVFGDGIMQQISLFENEK